MFLVVSSNRLQAQLMAYYALNHIGHTVSLLYENDDAYSMDYVSTFEDTFLGIVPLENPIVSKCVYERGDTNFEEPLSVVKSEEPDILVLAGSPPEVPLIIHQAREMDIESVFIGGDCWDDPLMYETLSDNSLLDDAYYCTRLDPSSADFLEAYRTKYGVEVHGIAATGFDAMRILVEAVEKVGSTDAVAVREAISTSLEYRGRRHPIKAVSIHRIVDGKPKQHSYFGMSLFDQPLRPSNL